MSKLALRTAAAGEGFPADPEFPQLRVASDPERMLQVFRAYLSPRPGKTCEIEACVPFRFRCRQSTSRCVLQYTLRLADPETGRRWEQWATGLVYATDGEARKLWNELLEDDPGRDIPEPWLPFDPVTFVPDLQMVVVVFPYDRRLRQLSSVLGNALHDVEPLLLERLGPGRWLAERRTVVPTRYRTELGAALRYTIDARNRVTAAPATVRGYVKVYRHEGGGETYRLLNALRARPDDRPYDVVRAVTYVSGLRVLVLEEARGTPLQDILLAWDDPFPALGAVARAVAALNQDSLPIARAHGLADQLDDVRNAAALVQWARPELAGEVRALAQAVMEGLPDVPPAPIHRDLKTDHIFVAGGRVTFIDFDSAALGDPVRDPAHLFAHITARVGLDGLPRHRARAAARAFAEDYFTRVPETWRRRFALHCAGALIEVAGGIFKRQEPAWRDKVTAAVEEARRSLG